MCTYFGPFGRIRAFPGPSSSLICEHLARGDANLELGPRGLVSHHGGRKDQCRPFFRGTSLLDEGAREEKVQHEK